MKEKLEDFIDTMTQFWIRFWKNDCLRVKFNWLLSWMRNLENLFYDEQF